MISARTAPRGVSAAITTVLAVTLGAGALAAPAAASPLPAAAPAEAGTRQAPVPYPVNGYFHAAGETGFLTGRPYSGQEFRWTRFADGSTTTVNASVTDSTGTDVIMSGLGRTLRRSLVVTLHDMADGGRTVTIDLGPLNGVYVRAVSRDTVLAEFTKPDGSVELRLVTRTGDTVTQRTIDGIPPGASNITATPARDGSVLVDYYLKSAGTPADWRTQFAVVDLAAAEVVSTHETEAYGSTLGEYSALSATHLAWAAEGGTYHTVDRATGTESVTDFELWEGERMAVALLDSWTMYGQASTLEGNGTGDTRKLVPFTAKSQASGETVELLDYVNTVRPGAGNTLFARGGTVAQGEGLYRIALGADGRPAAELVASTGQPTRLVHHGPQIMHTVDVTSPIPLKWKLSRENADVDLTIRHRATGESFRKTLHLYSESAGSEYYYGDGVFGITWAQIAAGSQMGRDAEPGEYEWSFTARPQNGVGPDVEATGTFVAARGLSTHHDLDWNGSPDLLARDAQGVLWKQSTSYDSARKTLVAPHGPDRIGGGWQVYDRIETVGGVGTGSADFVARDTSGVLWFYDVTGNGYRATFAARKSLGGGWNTYDRITGGSDLNRDGKADLVAADKAGALWLHPGTGNTAAPFAKRQKIGTGGWDAYNQITATGNIGGDLPGDLVARDKAGVLWLYLGRGDGTFAARKQIGGGWQAYTDTIGIGDANRDGRPDLYAYGPGNTGWFYAGTGNWRAPFAPRATSPALTGNPAYHHVS